MSTSLKEVNSPIQAPVGAYFLNGTGLNRSPDLVDPSMNKWVERRDPSGQNAQRQQRQTNAAADL